MVVGPTRTVTFNHSGLEAVMAALGAAHRRKVEFNHAVSFNH